MITAAQHDDLDANLADVMDALNNADVTLFTIASHVDLMQTDLGAMLPGDRAPADTATSNSTPMSPPSSHASQSSDCGLLIKALRRGLFSLPCIAIARTEFYSNSACRDPHCQ